MPEYIEREAVKEHINKLKFHNYGTAILAVMDVPTADVAEVKHGEWRNIKLITPWVATGICSACKTLSYINPDFPYSDFCPRCGAKMDGKGG